MQNLIGQTLDAKYAIERELGRGGMGTVYFATHIGTERPVAVKVISPQFMTRTEFVERFRREARAAGRLRHPNVVDVTDFGIAETKEGRTAYLVMEYLDGCTLGEILEEEKQIPLAWTLDILEQVASAVNEAHEQGIIHRDLKPDNIWLEPNQRGGYTVKVLDFGIAKLEENFTDNSGEHAFPAISAMETGEFRSQGTVADAGQAGTAVLPQNSTFVSEASTIALTPPKSSEANTMVQQSEDESESGTAILPRAKTMIAEEDGTMMMPSDENSLENSGSRSSDNTDDKISPRTSSAADLTRVGAVLGTPLYMSPEQCRGQKLDARSDIYSLGVISYQMLSGNTPFNGNYTDVMKAHKDSPVPPLQAKKIPSRVKNTVMTALAKDPEQRPQTAEAFASILRAHSEGMGDLFSRSLAIYGQYLFKFLALTFVIGLPFEIITVVKVTVQFLGIFGAMERGTAETVAGGLAFVNFFVQIFFAAVAVGTITWIVAQIMARPLRPFSLRAAFREVKKRWKPLLLASTIHSLLVFIGIFLCVVPGLLLSAVHMLIGPAIIMEGRSSFASFRRSRQLVWRSFWTVFGTILVLHLIPIILAMLLNVSIMSIAYNAVDFYERAQRSSAERASAKPKEEDMGLSVSPAGVKVVEAKDRKPESIFGTSVEPASEEERALQINRRKTATAVSQGIFDIIWSPIVIFVTSFLAVITGLIYFKTRQAGGESMQDLLAQFEENEGPRTKWQERVRERLVQSGRSNSKSNSKPGSKSGSRSGSRPDSASTSKSS